MAEQVSCISLKLFCFLACSGCSLSYFVFTPVCWFPVCRGWTVTQSLSGLQEHRQTWHSSQEQLSGKPSMPRIQLYKSMKSLNTIHFVFSDPLQLSASVYNFQLSLVDGYVVFIIGNNTLRSDKWCTDGSWHYLSAERRPTGYNMFSFCQQLCLDLEIYLEIENNTSLNLLWIPQVGAEDWWCQSDSGSLTPQQVTGAKTARREIHRLHHQPVYTEVWKH